MPKVLHLPLNVAGSEQIGQEKGFREVFGSENYVQFDFLSFCGQFGNAAANEELKNLFSVHRPDIMWAQFQETAIITPETIKFIREMYPKAWLTTWSGDARDYLPTYLSQVLPFMDIFYNDTDQVEMYKPYCKRYEFMPIAVDGDEVMADFPIASKVPEIIFIGNNYGGTFSNGRFREELMHRLSLEFGDKFGVFGNGWDSGQVTALGPIPLKQQGAYYRQAKIVLSIDHIQGILHWSERLPWALASGSKVIIEEQPHLSDNIKAVFRIFKKGNPENAISIIKQELETINRRGIHVWESNRLFILENHTWKNRAEQILKDYIERPQ